MDQKNGINLTLIEFLDILGSIPNSLEKWNIGDNMWDKCAENAGIPDNFVGDWVEVAPAMKALSVMIKAKIFREDSS